MTAMAALWLPILVASVVVFVASSLINMLPLWHTSDYPKLANEDKILDALRPLVTGPGDYMMPRPSSMADAKSAEFVAKVERGPRVIMTVTPGGPMTMSKELVLWFVNIVVINILTAYVAAHALLPGAPPRAVIRFAGLVSFIAYAVALWQISIWYRRSWSITMKATLDGLIYSALTALAFAYLWPRG